MTFAFFFWMVSALSSPGQEYGPFKDWDECKHAAMVETVYALHYEPPEVSECYRRETQEPLHERSYTRS